MLVGEGRVSFRERVICQLKGLHVQKLAVGDASSFESMTDDELRQFINGSKALEAKED